MKSIAAGPLRPAYSPTGSVGTQHLRVAKVTDLCDTLLPSQYVCDAPCLHTTIGNSWMTLHQFIFIEFFLTIVSFVSSWLASKNSSRIISRNWSDLYLLPHYLLQATSVIITSGNSGGIILSVKDLLCIPSKYSRGVQFVILALRIVCLSTIGHPWI